jgi:hypothetical protein
VAKITVSFTLDDKTDSDIARWLTSLPHGYKSEHIRETLRIGLARGGVTLGDVYRAVKELDRKVQAGGAVVNPGPRQEGDEPPDAAAALDRLAELGG